MLVKGAQVDIIHGGRRSRTPWSLAVNMGPALLVPPDGFAGHALVAMKLADSLEHSTIVQDQDNCNLPWTKLALCPWSKWWNTNIAYIVAVDIYRQSTGNPSAVSVVMVINHNTPKAKSDISKSTGIDMVMKAFWFFQSDVKMMWKVIY